MDLWRPVGALQVPHSDRPTAAQPRQMQEPMPKTETRLPDFYREKGDPAAICKTHP